MTVYSGGDFVLTNDSPADNTGSSPSVTVTNSPILSENTGSTKTIISDLIFKNQNQTFSNLNESMSYSKFVDLTCSAGGVSTISYALQPNGANEFPVARGNLDRGF
jgi:hypothetical protein